MSNVATIFNFLSFYGKTGAQLVDAGDMTKMANYLMNPNNGVTALAGGGQTGATVLSYGYNETSVVASGSDSVMLPPAVPGTFCLVHSTVAANALAIYAQSAIQSALTTQDQIINKSAVTLIANGSAYSLTAGHTVLFVCTTQGRWKAAFDV